MRNRFVVSVFFLLAFTVLPAHAAYVWEFNLPAGQQGNSHTYTSNLGVLNVTAYGFVDGSPNTLTNLYDKNESGDGWGVGIALDTVNHQIQSNDFVQLDFADPLTLKAIATSEEMLINDVQTGDAWKLYGSNTLGQLGTLLTTGNTENVFAIPDFGTYRYYGVTTSNGGVIIAGVTVDTACPEPATCALFGGSLVGLGCALRARRRRG